MMPTSYEVPDGPKMLRETLCVAQTRIGNSDLDQGRKCEHLDRLQRLIDACDVHRPLGPDGKHGGRHTSTCGCEDAAAPALRYMMATKAMHKLGDISRDKPGLCVIHDEDGDDFIGAWVTGLGYINVRFPKATTRLLTEAEIARYDGAELELSGRAWGQIHIDGEATDA